MNLVQTMSLTRSQLGTFLAPELLAKAKFVEGDAGDDYALFSVAYNHMLNGTDYVGVTVESDDEFDYRSVVC